MKITNVFAFLLIGTFFVFSACGPQETTDEYDDDETIEEEIDEMIDDEPEESEKDRILREYNEKVSEVRQEVQKLEGRLAEKDAAFRNQFVEQAEWMNNTLNSIERELGTLHYSTEEEIRERKKDMEKRMKQVEEQIEELEKALSN